MGWHQLLERLPRPGSLGDTGAYLYLSRSWDGGGLGAGDRPPHELGRRADHPDLGHRPRDEGAGEHTVPCGASLGAQRASVHRPRRPPQLHSPSRSRAKNEGLWKCSEQAVSPEVGDRGKQAQSGCLVSLTRNGTPAPALGVRCLSHWTTREAPLPLLLFTTVLEMLLVQ